MPIHTGKMMPYTQPLKEYGDNLPNDVYHVISDGKCTWHSLQAKDLIFQT
jgi:hypothetical protein